LLRHRTLTADLGNTRCKLALFSPEGAVTARVAFASALASVAEVEGWLASHPRPAQGAIASVAGDATRERWEQLLAPLCEVWLGTPPHGLLNRCDEPEKVGADRLFAARGAYELARRSCLVIDAGTALTVDALRVRGAPAGRAALPDMAEFLGGAIAPGPALLARALHDGGARLPLVAPAPGAAALGRDTRGALQAGIAVGFAGAARELARRVAEEAGLAPSDPIFLTGGARGFLATPGLFAAAPREMEDLVLLGLERAAREAAE
jgi:type III pantothenate kinase